MLHSIKKICIQFCHYVINECPLCCRPQHGGHSFVPQNHKMLHRKNLFNFVEMHTTRFLKIDQDLNPLLKLILQTPPN